MNIIHKGVMTNLVVMEYKANVLRRNTIHGSVDILKDVLLLILGRQNRAFRWSSGLTSRSQDYYCFKQF